MSKAKQMRLIGRPERIPRPTSIGARGQANQVVAMADGRLDALVEPEALSRLDESRDQPGAAVDDVEALRKRREFGAREPRGPPGRGKIVALKRGSRFDAALRDARKASIKSVISGRSHFVDRGEACASPPTAVVAIIGSSARGARLARKRPIPAAPS
jgi:hypothetical protein